MRFLRSVSLILSIFLFSCAPKIYQNPKNVTINYLPENTRALRPQFDKQLYNCVVDGKTPLGKKYHLSGFLILKELPEGGTRAVFQNQMGITYFDMGWNQDDKFQVFSIIEQMNKPSLIKLLQKDFELLLFKNLPVKPIGNHQFNNDTRHHVQYNLEKGFVYYVFDNKKLQQIVNADDKRKVIVMDLQPATELGKLPQNIKINNLRANFTIDLQQINDSIQDATE